MSRRHPIAVTLVGFEPREGASALQSVRDLMPDVSTTLSPSTAEAARAGSLANVEVLVIADANPEQVSAALAVHDEERLPRWAVIAIGDSEECADVPTLARSDVDAASLRLAFQCAIRERELRRQNALFRGDLRTLGSRVNHDLRAPLSAVYTTCEVVKELLAEGAPLEPGLLESISDSADELTRLTDRLTLMVRATADPRPPARFWMAESVTRACDRMQFRIQQKEAQLTQPDSWPEVSGVACWIEAVWCAFLESALQHDAGRPRIDLGWQGDGRENVFRMRTPGAGAAALGRPAHIVPFHLLHDRRGSAEIGLSIARRLVELQGGRCGPLTASEGGPGLYFTLPSEASSPPPVPGT